MYLVFTVNWMKAPSERGEDPAIDWPGRGRMVELVFIRFKILQQTGRVGGFLLNDFFNLNQVMIEFLQEEGIALVSGIGFSRYPGVLSREPLRLAMDLLNLPF